MEPTAEQVRAGALVATVYALGKGPEDYKQFEAMAGAIMRVALNKNIEERTLNKWKDIP
jgi:hypothetical protein